MRRRSHQRKHRGVTVVWTVLTIIPVITFVALAVDLGLVMTCRSQCQTAADTAAMAGVRTLNGNEEDGYTAWAKLDNGRLMTLTVALQDESGMVEVSAIVHIGSYMGWEDFALAQESAQAFVDPKWEAPLIRHLEYAQA